MLDEGLPTRGAPALVLISREEVNHGELPSSLGECGEVCCRWDGDGWDNGVVVGDVEGSREVQAVEYDMGGVNVGEEMVTQKVVLPPFHALPREEVGDAVGGGEAGVEDPSVA